MDALFVCKNHTLMTRKILCVSLFSSACPNLPSPRAPHSPKATDCIRTLIGIFRYEVSLLLIFILDIADNKPFETGEVIEIIYINHCLVYISTNFLSIYWQAVKHLIRCTSIFLLYQQ